MRAELGVSEGLPQSREDILRPELIQKPRSREHRVCLDPGTADDQGGPRVAATAYQQLNHTDTPRVECREALHSQHEHAGPVAQHLEQRLDCGCLVEREGTVGVEHLDRRWQGTLVR